MSPGSIRFNMNKMFLKSEERKLRPNPYFNLFLYSVMWTIEVLKIEIFTIYWPNLKISQFHGNNPLFKKPQGKISSKFWERLFTIYILLLFHIQYVVVMSWKREWLLGLTCLAKQEIVDCCFIYLWSAMPYSSACFIVIVYDTFRNMVRVATEVAM